MSPRTIARESDGGVYMHAGPEIGVAATKSFTSQVTILSAARAAAGAHAAHSPIQRRAARIIAELDEDTGKGGARFSNSLSDEIKAIAEKYAQDAKGMLFLGQAVQLRPPRCEAALKMKEISYIYASGHPSAELKHGIIALVKEDMPCVFIATDDEVFEKNVGNIEEVKARRGPVFAIANEGNTALEGLADDVVYIPEAPAFLTPILASVPLQLFAYHLAVARGCDVDKPRNLAKSVTVE